MAMMVALFLEAYMHNFNIVYITLFVIFSLAISGCYFGRINLYNLELITLPQERIFAKTPAHIKWRIINNAPNPAYDITCSTDDTKQHFSSIESEVLLDLSPIFQKRGDISYPKVHFESRFPLLHVRFFKVEKSSQYLCIYPHSHGVHLEDYLKEQPSYYGERSDFEGLRSYETSDTPSLIYWPSLAKAGNLMSRNFSYVSQVQSLHFDFMSCAKNDEARLSQLCLWVLECEKQARHFSIQMPNEILDSKKESYDTILQKLARY